MHSPGADGVPTRKPGQRKKRGKSETESDRRRPPDRPAARVDIGTFFCLSQLCDVTQALAQRRSYDSNPPKPDFAEVCGRRESLFSATTRHAVLTSADATAPQLPSCPQRPAALPDFTDKDEHIYLLASDATHGIDNLPLQCAVRALVQLHPGPFMFKAGA